jgi:hypothetical protein
VELAEIQHILSRLYTEELLRKTFFTDRNLFYEQHKINSSETIQFLNELKQEQVDFFAKGLLSKRFHAVVKLMPASSFILGDKFHILFRAYAALFNPAGTHKHHVDALAFCDFLNNEMQPSGYPKEFVAAMIRFEKKQMENFVSQKKWRVARFNYNPIPFQRMINMGEKPELPGKSRTIIFWKKGQVWKVFGGK